VATQNDFELEEDLNLDIPKKYKVFLLNDDYTTMDFVVDILIKIFHKNYEEAEKIMLDIHKKDKGLCGVYSYEIAETKVAQVHKRARDNGFPLRAYMEEE
jgi:ATP-dependent Clp protease adaptor protein ClpS